MSDTVLPRRSVPETPAAPEAPDAPEQPDRMVDPRAVRVALAGPSAHVGLPPMVVEPPEAPMTGGPHLAGHGPLGGVAPDVPEEPEDGAAGDDDVLLIDGVRRQARLERSDPLRATLVTATPEDPDGMPEPTRVLLPPPEAPSGVSGVTRREVVVDGWRIEVEVESERRASLRDRARRGREESAHGGPTEVRAIIPGRVVSVSVAAGDDVVAGQQLLVVEAMKMQNELRAPRDGSITSVAVGPAQTIEIGDLLLVLE